ncbi:MAG: DNA polymerase I [Candidatus Dependentiae bacterium]|nr:DNA polymerase I [Candidatus Dependentiae bacterium]
MIQFDPKKFDAKKTFFLIDGSSLLYRGYYGMKPLHTSKGIPVQAVYAFCRMIKRLVDTFNPHHVAIVWDSKGKTTRHAMYPAYKATRQAAPSDLFAQKEYILTFATLVGIVQVAKEGIEADDLMYSLAQERVAQGDTVVVVTSDKDMGQMLCDKIFVYDPLKEVIYDPVNFAEKMGFPVHKLPFYFALLGDASDNIPGVRGVGKKTALELVNTFDSLEDVYARIYEVKQGRARSALQEYKDDAFLSRDLFLLQYHKTALEREGFAFDKAHWKKAVPLFQELEFTSLVKEVGETKVEKELNTQEIVDNLKKRDFQLVTTVEQLSDLCALLKDKKAFAFDTETNGLQPLAVNLVGVSFCVQEGQSFYVPCGHNTSEQQITLEQLVAHAAPLFADTTITKYAHNVKYDQLVLASHGIDMQGPIFDTCIAASLVTKGWQSAALKKLSLYYFDEPMLTYEQMVAERVYKDFSYVPIDDALYYAANDAHQTFRLVSLLQKELELLDMISLFDTIETPLIQVLCEMEKEGIILDTVELAQVNKVITQGLVFIEDEIRTLADTTINLNSPKQVGELLFEKLQLTPIKKSSKGGAHSTDQEVLAQLAKEHPVPGLIVKYRELAKLKSTYLDALPTYVNKKTGRIHTSFSQIRVATGRLASSDPNMQNIPTTVYGIAIRGAFKPQQGHVFISADYSQIELRVLAHLSQDACLIAAFNNNHDIHAETASRLFDIPIDEVSHDQRQMGKRINFSILYGLTPYGLAKDLDISFKDAKKYIEKYFAQYPGVSAWMDGVIAFAKGNGYVKTHWGRRRDVPGIYEKNKHLHDEAMRVAVNTVAQGTAAEIMKIGMINVRNELKKRGLEAHIVLQIHDELLITVAVEQHKEVEALVVSVLESVVSWSVPLVVTTRIGNDWKQVSK